jgi:TPR repeat protein
VLLATLIFSASAQDTGKGKTTVKGGTEPAAPVVSRASANPRDAAAYRKGVAAIKGRDYATALKVLRPLAEKGHVLSQFILAQMYKLGKGVPQDFAKSAKWYLKAAEQNLAEAQYTLVNYYGMGAGVPRDSAQSVKWYKRAAANGHAFVQYSVGSKYLQGRDRPKDYAMALK